MDKIYECAAKFVALENCKYHFVVSQNRQSRELLLNFNDSDFFHLAGLHYLTDISLPQNRKNTLKDIIEKKKITDEVLNKSRFYINSKPDKDIKSRIEELRFLEEYLDTNNIIRIYNTQNREENPEYLCVESFFKKDKITYGGNKLYWLLKEKITMNEHITLYKHKDYVQS